MRTIAIDVVDAPILLRSGDVLDSVRVVKQQPTYGRVLFADDQPAVEVAAGARDVLIRNCRFECLS